MILMFFPSCRVILIFLFSFELLFFGLPRVHAQPCDRKLTISPWTNDRDSPLRWGRFSQNQLDKLHQLRLGVVGLGAIGGALSQLASMMEITHFNIADFDKFEVHNRSRAIFAGEASKGRPKTEVTKKAILNVNPNAEVMAFEEGVTIENIDEFLEGVDLVIDGIDFFAMETRRMVFNRALALGIPVVTVGPLGMTIVSAYFEPGGMNFDQYFGVDESTPKLEMMFRFVLGMAPQLMQRNDYIESDLRLNEGKATTDPRSVFVAAAELANWIERIFLENKSSHARPIPYTYQVGVMNWKKNVNHLPRGLAGPWQKIKLNLLRGKFYRVFSKAD